MNTKVVNLRMEAYDVYIGRAGRGHDGYFGNPFRLGFGEPRGSTLERHKTYFLTRIASDPEFQRRVLELRGKRLGCFCAPLSCHGDVIVWWLEQGPGEAH